MTFTLIVTDFGNPMVIGGDYSVLATEVYNQVIGQAQFERGAVIGILLLAPAMVAKWIEKRLLPPGNALVSAQSRALMVSPAPLRDALFGVYAGTVAAVIASVVLIVVAASFVTLWPYNLAPTLKHYSFDVQNGLEPLWNSVLVSLLAAVAGVIFAQAAFDPYRGREIQPGAEVVTDDAIDAFVRQRLESAYHPAGTCRMGDPADPMTVVDPDARVAGTEALRVVDSSIMPTLTTGNLNAPTIMIGEKMADSILGRPPLPASNATYANAGMLAGAQR